MVSATVRVIGPATTKTTLSLGSKPLTFGETIHLWQESEDFRLKFTAMLADSPFIWFFWETPPVTQASLTQPFEFVLISAPFTGINLDPDPAAFAEHFRSAPDDPVVTFSNLSGNATLVVPAPRTEDRFYTDLAQFLRHAPQDQISALWRSVGVAMEARVSSAPVWLSTAGMGVSWLHVRLDSRPKYYHHEPYKSC